MTRCSYGVVRPKTTIPNEPGPPDHGGQAHPSHDWASISSIDLPGGRQARLIRAARRANSTPTACRILARIGLYCAWPCFLAVRFAIHTIAALAAPWALPNVLQITGRYTIFCAANSPSILMRSPVFRKYIASMQSSPAATHSGDVTPTSRAAKRPGMAAGDRTSAGRSSGWE